MQDLELTKRRIKSAEDLASVTRTMKTIAVVGIRQYEAAVQSLSVYAHTIETGLMMLLRNAEDQPDRAQKAGGKNRGNRLRVGSRNVWAVQSAGCTVCLRQVPSRRHLKSATHLYRSPSGRQTCGIRSRSGTYLSASRIIGWDRHACPRSASHN